MMSYKVKHKTGWIGEVTAIDGEFITVKNGSTVKEYAFPDVFEPDQYGVVFEPLEEEFAEIIANAKKALEEETLRKQKEAEEIEEQKRKLAEEKRLKKEAEQERKAEAERKRVEELRRKTKEADEVSRKWYELQKGNRFELHITPKPGLHPVAKERPYEEVSLTKEQEEALAMLESGENVFLSGEAGTGKSFVINEFLRRNEKRNIIVCAPTGIAAINIGGSTLHRMFKIPLEGGNPEDYNHFPDDAIVKADIIVIDEISMLRMDNFEYVIRTIHRAEEIPSEARKKATGVPGEIRRKQVIVVGDFFQLPPVITSKGREILEQKWGVGVMGSGFAFRSKLWKEMNFRPVILKQVMRQEDGSKFTENLNLIRHGDRQGVDWFNENAKTDPLEGAIYLCARNAEVDQINAEKTEKLPGKEKVYCASMDGEVRDSDKATMDALVLKEGMQVMTLVNQPEGLYQNGSIGKIKALYEDYVLVHFENGNVVPVSRFNWDIFGYEVQEDKVEKVVLGTYKQLPLKVAYAITIHKSQGQTYDKANIAPDCFDDGQLYVALSRVKMIEGLCLTHKISPFALRTSKEVQDFYKDSES